MQYRERARKHIAEQAAVDELLLSSAQQLASLECERAEYWSSFVESYRNCCTQQGIVLDGEAWWGRRSSVPDFPLEKAVAM